MPLKIVPMEEVCSQLDALFPDLEYEADRAWIWITSEIGPIHRSKCTCSQCAERAGIRKAIGREGIGFCFAPNGHTCPSGATSYWGHRCDRPTRFKRRSKRKSEFEPETKSETSHEFTDQEL